jgi:hypothetical protein
MDGFDSERDALIAIMRKYGVSQEVIDEFFEAYP